MIVSSTAGMLVVDCSLISEAKEKQMNGILLIRVVAGILAVVVLFIIIWRRRRLASK